MHNPTIGIASCQGARRGDWRTDGRQKKKEDNDNGEAPTERRTVSQKSLPNLGNRVPTRGLK